MSGENKAYSAYTVYKNEEFNLEEYQALGVYTLIFNAIANSPSTYGLSAKNADNEIDTYIENHIDDPEFLKKVGLTGSAVLLRSQYFHGEKFKKIIDYAKKLAAQRPGNVDNGFLKNRLTNNDIVDVLTGKRLDVREYFQNQFKAVKGKPFNFSDDGKGNNKSGILYRKYEIALSEQKAMKRETHHKFRQFARSALGFIVSGAVGVASLAAVFASGGAALGVLAGTSYAAGSLGVAGVGVIGSIVSGKLLVNFGSKLKDRFVKWNTQRRATRDQRLSRGAYEKTTKDDQEIFKGVRDTKDKYLQALAINTWFKKGGGKKFTGKNRYLNKYLKRALEPQGVGLKDFDYMKDQLQEFSIVSNDDRADGFKAIERLVSRQKSLNTEDITSVASWQNIFKKDPNFLTKTEVLDASGAPVVDPSTGATQTRNKTLQELIDQYNVLNNYKADFEKNPETKADFEKMMRHMDMALVDIINQEIFEKPYSAGQIADIENIVNTSSVVKQRLTDSPFFGDLTKKIKNYVSFVNFESDAESFESLDAYAGVGVQNQMVMSEQSILNGTKLFGTNNDPQVISLANAISSATSRAALDSLDANIAAISDSKTRTYLEFMKNKRKDSTILNKTDLEQMIRSSAAPIPAAINNILDKIANLKQQDVLRTLVDNTSKIYYKKPNEKDEFSEIRRDILNLSVDNSNELLKDANTVDETKENLMNALVSQYKAFEDKGSIEIKERALMQVRNNAEPSLSEYIDEIEKFEKYDFEKANSLYDSKISKIDDIDIKEYLTMRLSEQLHKKLLLEIRSLQTKAAGVKLTEVIDILSKITNDRYMTQYQKEILISESESIIEKVTNIAMNKYEKLFPNLSEEQTKSIQDLTKEFAKGGLRQYMDKGTAQGTSLKETITRLQDNLDKVDIFIVSGGDVKPFDNRSEAELKKMSKLLYNRPTNEDINGVFAELNSILDITSSINTMTEFTSDPTTFDVSAFDATVDPTKINKNAYATKIKTKLDSILKEPNKNDKLLYLLQLKRISMQSYKSHMNQFLNDSEFNGTTIEAAIRKNGNNIRGRKNEIDEKWKMIAQKIDDSISDTLGKLKQDVDNSTDREKVKTAQKALDAYQKEGVSKSFMRYIQDFTPENMSALTKASSTIQKGA